MFVTQSPCKALGFYVQVCNSAIRLDGVYNAAGIQIGELVTALERIAPEVKRVWKKSALDSRKRIADETWTKYTLDTAREKWWNVVIWPALSKALNHAGEG
jgi:hypothetical protein